MRTLSQHLLLEYTYEQAMAMGANACYEGLKVINNPFSFGPTAFAGTAISARGSLLRAWDTGYKIQQKAK